MYTTMNRTGTQSTTVSHEGDHGFCCVCGMVWPCSWARRHAMPIVYKPPTPRLPVAR